MASFTSLLNIGKSSLLATQYGLGNTARNIANANNPDYSRRRLTLGDIVLGTNNKYDLSEGIRIIDINRSYNEILNNQIYDMRQSKAEWDTRTEILEQLEIILGEDSSTSIRDSLNEFFNAWETLSQNPSGVAERSELLSKSTLLTDKINEMALMLHELRAEVKGQIELVLDEINLSLEQLSTINFGIKQNTNRNDLASKEALSSLLDERDRIMGELSELIGNNRWNNDDLTTNVAAGGSSLLVDDILFSLESEFETDADGQHIIHIISIDPNNSKAELRVNKISGGKLKGLIDAYTEDITSALESVDTLAYNLITKVNQLHKNGYNIYDIDDLAGATSTPFFKELEEDTLVGASSTIMISPEIGDDPMKIAAALPVDDSISPDPITNPVHYDNNENARKIAALRDERINGQTMNEYFASELSRLGLDVKRAGDRKDYFESMHEQWWDRKQAVTGVSLNEEYIDLIQYQSTYSASAKLISIADEMLNTLINIVS